MAAAFRGILGFFWSAPNVTENTVVNSSPKDSEPSDFNIFFYFGLFSLIFDMAKKHSRAFPSFHAEKKMMMRPMDADDDAARVEFLANRPESSLYNKREKPKSKMREKKKKPPKDQRPIFYRCYFCAFPASENVRKWLRAFVGVCKAVRVLRTLFA